MITTRTLVIMFSDYCIWECKVRDFFDSSNLASFFCVLCVLCLCLAPLPNAPPPPPPHIKEMTILVIFNNLPPQRSAQHRSGGGFSLSLFFTLGNFCCPLSFLPLLLFLLSSNRNSDGCGRRTKFPGIALVATPEPRLGMT